MAKVITVAEFDNMDQGKMVGTFTQLKLALAFIDTEGLTVLKRPATYERISAAMRKHEKQIATLHDEFGCRAFSLRKHELNPVKEGD
jgi:hypothetical protein